MALETATTLDVYHWPVGSDLRFSWAMETSDDPNATSGAPEDVTDVTAVRLWLQQRVAPGVTPPAAIAYTNTGGQITLDLSPLPDNPALLNLALSGATDGPDVPEGEFDALISFDRAGGVRDDVAQLVIVRKQGPRPGP